MTSRRLAAWTAIIVVAAAATFLAGRSLRSTSETVSAFDLDASPYTEVDSAAGFSKGGFTGFGEAAGLDGRTTISGRISRFSDNELVLETAAGASTVRLTGDQVLRQMEPSSLSALKPGATVAVRLTAPGSDQAKAVLLLSDP
jgi:hypothetical protein